MKQGQNPAQQRALLYLTRLARSRVGAANGRLPRLKALAAAAGVSPVTMWKAVGRMKAEGVLRTHHSRGITLTGAAPRAPEATAPGEPRVEPRPARWEHVARRLGREMLNGLYAPGDLLPPVKELLARHGVCYRTLRRALEALTAQDALTRDRTRYRVPEPSRRRYGTVVLIGLSDPAGDIMAASDFRQRLFAALEAECTRIQMPLEMAGYDGPRRLLPGLAEQRRFFAGAGLKSVLGFLVVTAAMTTDDAGELLRQLVPLGKPVAVLDTGGEITYPRTGHPRARIRRFSLGVNARAGAQLGQFLMRLGHRRVAYISHLGRSVWSQNRLAGLRNAFASSGVADAVSTAQLDLFAPFDALPAGESEDIGPVLVRWLGAPRPERPQASALMAVMNAVMSETRERFAIQRRLEPLLAGLLGEPAVTAWVCANDVAALISQDFLRRRRVTVPGRLSLAGFDDTVEAFVNKLTSYNFNTPAILRAMLAFLLDSGRAVGTSGLIDEVWIDGYVSARASSGPPSRG